MNAFVGTVTGIDRANREVTATIDGIPTVATYSSEPEESAPWPGCDAWFEEQGAVWHCLSPIGDRRVLFHDDFTRVSSPNGDTPWNLSAGHAYTLTQATGVGGAGVLAIAAASANFDFVYKDAGSLVLPADRGILLSGRLRTSGAGWFFGLIEDVTSGASSFAQVVGSTFGDPIYVWSNNSTVPVEDASTVDGTTHAVETWYEIEMLWASGMFCAWVNGNGPTFTVDGTAPDASESLTPFLRIDGTATLYADYVACSAVTLSEGFALAA